MFWKPITSYYKKTPAGNHEIRWRNDQGKDSQKTFKTKLEAVAWQEYLRTGEVPEFLPQKPAHVISLRQFSEIFRERHCSLKSYATGKLYMRDLELWVLPYLGDKQLSRIDDEDIVSWMVRLIADRKVSAKSLNNYRKTLHKLFNCACTWKYEDRYGNRIPYVANNPVTPTKPLLDLEEKEIITWNEAEQKKFLSFVINRHPFVYEISHLVLGTGLRRGEVTALKREHLDFVNRQIIVKESFCFHSRAVKHTKSKRIRIVPMNDEILDLLERHRELPPGKRIFEGFDFEKFSTKLSVWCKRAQVRRIGIHGLRHTFATSLVRAGVDVKRIQMLLGHAEITTTMRYVHLVNGDLVNSTMSIEVGILPNEYEKRPIPRPRKRRPRTIKIACGENAEILKK